MQRLIDLPDAVPDASFALIEQYKRDPSPLKVDLSPGFYRDQDAKPFILPSVKRVHNPIQYTVQTEWNLTTHT